VGQPRCIRAGGGAKGGGSQGGGAPDVQTPLRLPISPDGHLHRAEAVKELRWSTEAAWRSEQDANRLRARAVRVCEEALARAQRMLERVRATHEEEEPSEVGLAALARAQRMLRKVRASEDTEELREVGLGAVMTASRDTLCAMAVQAAAQDGVDVNTLAEGAAADEAWLGVAARGGLVETVRALAAAGAEVDHANVYGCTALTVAATNGHVEVLRVLVEAGAEVDHADAQGLTALCAAAHRGQVDAVRVLLEAGADPNRATNNGLTPLAFARAYTHEEAVLALMEAGATE
jgi:hypothetical protein